MAKGDFYLSEDVEKHYPALDGFLKRKYTYCINPYDVGISKKGNVKVRQRNRPQIVTLDISKLTVEAKKDIERLIERCDLRIISSDGKARIPLFPVNVQAKYIKKFFNLDDKYDDWVLQILSPESGGKLCSPEGGEPISIQIPKSKARFIAYVKNADAASGNAGTKFELAFLNLEIAESAMEEVSGMLPDLLHFDALTLSCEIANGVLTFYAKYPDRDSAEALSSADIELIGKDVLTGDIVKENLTNAVGASFKAYVKSRNAAELSRVQNDLLSDIVSLLREKEHRRASKHPLVISRNNELLCSSVEIPFLGYFAVESIKVPAKDINKCFDKQKEASGLITYKRAEHYKETLNDAANDIYDEVLKANMPLLKDRRSKKINSEFSEDISKIESFILNCIKKCNASNLNSWVSGKAPNVGGETLIYIPVTDSIACKAAALGVVGVVDGKVTHMVVSSRYEDFLKATSSSKFVRVKQELLDWYKQSGLTISIIKGCGCTFGNSSLSIMKDGMSLDYEWKSPSCIDSLPVWRTAAQKNEKEIVDLMRKALDKREKEIRSKYGKFINSMLAKDIISFVEENEDYITQNAAVNHLRGLKGNFRGDITDKKCLCGKYNAISADEIHEMFDSMIKNGIFWEKELKGTYGRFYILKLGKAAETVKNIRPEMPDGKSAVNMAHRGTIISDYVAKEAFDIISKKESIEAADYIALLNLIDRKGFICNEHDTFVNVFQKAPEEVMDYIKMAKTLEEEKYKKHLYLEILRA